MTLQSDRIQRALESLTVFRSFPAEHMALLERSLTVRRYEQRETIFCADDVLGDNDGVCWIVEGRVEISVSYRTMDLRERDEWMVQLLSKNDVFGEYALVTGAPRNATATAVVETQVLVLPICVYTYYRQHDLAFTLALHEVIFAGLSQRQVSARTLLRLHDVTPVRRRMLIFLSSMAHPVVPGADAHVIDHLDSSQIAQMLCVSRGTVSEILNELKAQGLVELRRRRHLHIGIPSLNALHAALDAEGGRSGQQPIIYPKTA